MENAAGEHVTLEEQQKLYLRKAADGTKTVYTVTDIPGDGAVELKGAEAPKPAEAEETAPAGPRRPGRRPGGGAAAPAEEGFVPDAPEQIKAVGSSYRFVGSGFPEFEENLTNQIFGYFFRVDYTDRVAA